VFEKKPTDEEIKERASLVIRTKWAAWKTINAGGTYSVGDKKLYESVRKRLKGALRNEEKLSRFRLL